MKALLSTTYFGPVQWYQKLYRHEAVQIEQWESFQKQTYRNRCLIATTQGIQALTVPVERKFTVYGLQFTDDNSAVSSADKEGLASKSTVNCQLSTVNSINDFRDAINPKHPLPDPDFDPKPYYQVYQQKHGFLPNLSILDLLFNMGPEGIFYL